MHGFPGLHIHLLGSFRLLMEGKLVMTIVQDRMQALIAFLLLNRHSPQPRQLLAYLFWPDSTEAQARTNLRQLLHHLHRALPEAEQYLRIEKQTLQWRPEASFTLDVAEFERDAIEAEQAWREGRTAATRQTLESAVRRYQGDLLPGCYDDWIFPERERLSQIYFSALEQLISLSEAQQDYRGALAYAEQLLRRDPLRETTYQHLMRLHGLSGDRARALQVYHLCVTTLERELGVEPSAETRQGYFDLLSKQAPVVAKPGRRRVSLARSPLIGRQFEWNELKMAWKDSTAGHARLVIISGEAGIGKTRLAEEFVEWAGQEGASIAKTRSYAAEGQLAYAPVTELLRSDLFRTALSALNPVWLIELARLMPELLEGKADRGKPEPITSSWQRKHLFEALVRAMNTVREPLVLLFDDLQWCDRDTVEWLHYLLRVSAGSKLLVISTVRVEEIDDGHRLPPMLLDVGSRDQLTEVELGPLHKADATILAQQIAGKPIGPDEAAHIYVQSEGNPLFVVEIARAAISQSSSGSEIEAAQVAQTDIPSQPGASSADLPSRVYSVIQARLAQLSPAARDLASLAATMGRAFSIGVLSLASEIDDEALVRALDELWRRRIVREQDGGCYDFSHDLLREVAYAEMSMARRALLHKRVAKALEQAYSTNLDAVSSQIAVHYAQASLTPEAVAYYRRAVRVAQATFSNAEVIRLAESVLALLPRLPNDRGKREAELSLLLSLATAQTLTKGYGHPLAQQTLMGAWDVAQSLGNSPNTVPVAAGLWLCCHMRGDMSGQAWWAGRLERELENQPDENLLPAIYFVLVGTAYFEGKFEAAKRHGEAGLALCQTRKPVSQSLLFGYEPRTALTAYLAFSLWMLGYPDQARRRMRQAVTEAKNAGHPDDILLFMCQELFLRHLCGDLTAVLELAADIGHRASETKVPHSLPFVQMFHGRALLQLGHAEEGLGELRQGLGTWRAMGAGVGVTFYLGLLAESCLVAGRYAEGLAAVAEGLEMACAGGEPGFQADLYRYQGELILARDGDEPAAEACIQTALDTARRQQARSYELRAATSLSRLWQRQGKTAEAYQVLADVYHWFSEGFDTADLRAAKAQLDRLA